MNETPILRVGGLDFDVAAVSEQGPRSENQDAFTADRLRDAGVVAVADGMGGERGGRYAAEVALRTLLEAAPLRSADAAREAVRRADRAVQAAAQEDPAERAGMGCALALLALAQDGSGGWGWVGAHVGDVRILSRSPDGVLRLETRDHTPAFARWEAGEVPLDAIPDTPGANRLQRAVGRGGEADASWIPLRPGWRYALISDGVSKAMRLDELGVALAAPSASEACELIARKVEERGPDDNYTAVVVGLSGGVDGGAPAPPPSPLSPGPVKRTPSSPWLPLLAVVAMLALGASAFAWWSTRELGARVAERSELARVEERLDSLLAAGDTLGSDSLATDTADPFRPTLPPVPDTTLTRRTP